VTVLNGLSVLQTSASLVVYDKLGNDGAGPEIKVLHWMVPFDGLYLWWQSIPGAYYNLAYKRDLNDNVWILLRKDIPSGGSLTDTILDEEVLAALQNGFFGVFRSN
jgi:hypothetical protein